MPVLPVYPLNGFDAVDDEDVAGGAEQADGAGHGEGPEEFAGAIDDDADQSGPRIPAMLPQKFSRPVQRPAVCGPARICVMVQRFAANTCRAQRS